jgi:transcriptional regulator with XRE-family HTH domain
MSLLRSCFGQALRAARKYRSMPQEGLEVVSSRTYISSLERGLKSPTLDKVEQIASALHLHPLSLHCYTYVRNRSVAEQRELLRTIRKELRELIASEKKRGAL